jgi:hypothetical protein
LTPLDRRIERAFGVYLAFDSLGPAAGRQNVPFTPAVTAEGMKRISYTRAGT